MVGGLAAAAIAADHRSQVQALDHLHHEPRQVPLRQPFVHRRRQQETGVAVGRRKVLMQEGPGAGIAIRRP